MPADQMPAQSIRQAQGFFQIDGCVNRIQIHGAIECLARHIHGERVAVQGNNGEAYTVHRNAVAELHVAQTQCVRVDGET